MSGTMYIAQAVEWGLLLEMGNIRNLSSTSRPVIGTSPDWLQQQTKLP